VSYQYLNRQPFNEDKQQKLFVPTLYPKYFQCFPKVISFWLMPLLTGSGTPLGEYSIKNCISYDKFNQTKQTT